MVDPQLAALQEENERLKAQLHKLQEQLGKLPHAGDEPHDAPQPAAASLASSQADGISSTPSAPRTDNGPGVGTDRSTSQDNSGCSGCSMSDDAPARTFVCQHTLSKQQVERYSRHLLLPAFGAAAQERLCKGSVLIIGCGGLGSPAAMYLAAAGVGRLGLVDHDTVDTTNLHRQVMHADCRVGMAKALSAAMTCSALNPLVQVEPHACGFTPANALGLVGAYDVVVDCSDNPATRYLVSDACVVSGRPLVSAAAVGTDGQLTVYHHGEDGPCYRCLFPESPSAENCSRCGEAGVLGVVPGIMGCLQALEAIKLLSGVGEVLSKKLLLFDALTGRFTSVKLRGRAPGCAACGSFPWLTREALPSYDYVRFTGQPAGDGPPEQLQLLDPATRLTAAQLRELLQQQQQDEASAAIAGGGDERVPSCSGGGDGGQRRAPHGGFVLLDVRPGPQYDAMALPGAVHVPFEQFDRRLDEVLRLCGMGDGGSGGDGGSTDGSGRRRGPAAAAAAPASAQPWPSLEDGGEQQQLQPAVVVLCRRGNNSQRIAARLRQLGVVGVTDLVGGYQAWAQEVDGMMPLL